MSQLYNKCILTYFFSRKSSVWEVVSLDLAFEQKTAVTVGPGYPLSKDRFVLMTK